MIRQLCATGLCVVLVAAAVAAEPEKKEPAKRSKKLTPAFATAATPVAIPSASARKQLEALLETPARLDFKDRQRVTVGDVLERLHEQHDLSFRFDAPTLASLLTPTPHSTSVGCPPAMTAGLPMPNFRITSASLRAPNCRSSTPTYGGAPVDAFGPDENPPRAYYQGSEQNFPAAPAYRAVAVSSSSLAEPEDLPAPRAATPAAAAPAKAAPAAAPSAAPTGAPAAAATATPRGAVPAPVEALPNAATPRAAEGGFPTPGGVPVPATDSPLPASPEGPHSPATPQTCPAPAMTVPQPANFQEILAELLKAEIDVQNLDLSRASVATVLRHALDAAPLTGNEDYTGMPILFSNAMLLDYLIEDHGLLITTRMQALTKKETRVYSIKHLADIAPDELSKTIRHSIRPWSWRSQINDLGDQLKGSPLPADMLTSIVKTGVQMAGSDFGVSVTPNSEADAAAAAKKSSAEEARQMEMLGNAIANGLVTLAQATVSALEMVHYAEPPTGTIQILGTRLIITQSQTAHREIAELLKQLEE